MFKISRDWLMWFILTMSAGFYRTCVTELIELLEILYRDDEPQLPNPQDMNSFISVVRMAPVSIWIYLNHIKSSNTSSTDANSSSSSGQSASSSLTKSSSQIRPLVMPEIFRNNYAFLQESLPNLNFQDYSISIYLNACKIHIDLVF